MNVLKIVIRFFNHSVVADTLRNPQAGDNVKSQLVGPHLNHGVVNQLISRLSESGKSG